MESCSCSSSCYDCLRTYTNQIFHHELDRRPVADFLRQLVERVRPDDSLKALAPDANRMPPAAIAERLRRYCEQARAETILYLPEIGPPFNLELLTKLVRSLAKQNTPLNLIVGQLPVVTSGGKTARVSTDAILVLRKRLCQWLDQGLLVLHQGQPEGQFATQLTLGLSSQSANRIALQISLSETGEPSECLQTRSKDGVQAVINSLKNLQAQATLVAAAALDDPQTTVIFPEPGWGLLDLETLQTRLGFKDERRHYEDHLQRSLP
jgi:hypothetical protein